MPLSLIPEKNGRGESVKVANIENAIAAIQEIALAVDNGTDNNCLIAWLNQCYENGQPVDPLAMAQKMKVLYDKLSNVHLQLSSARPQR